MDGQQTCGKGLSDNSALPAKLSEVVEAVAAILELHMRALDPSDSAAGEEHVAYGRLALLHREAAAQLRALAGEMAACVDMPMAIHDEQAMRDPANLRAFEQLVATKRSLRALLEVSEAEHGEVLEAMQSALGD